MFPRPIRPAVQPRDSLGRNILRGALCVISTSAGHIRFGNVIRMHHNGMIEVQVIVTAEKNASGVPPTSGIYVVDSGPSDQCASLTMLDQEMFDILMVAKLAQE